ncbi:unnamed protein product [Notodromas monacha]|uniref:Aquaporin 14 n=1 Tax=Notodromas monacha TaxID=399045 RepID=A0A7R9BJI5_9CRUS|nr:unnamed protein product [Notodromas monacha]CAG0915134.1 unnamed protein product [Notodromas monacha]
MGKLDCLVWLGLKQGPPGSTIDGVVTWRMLIAEYLGTLLLVFFGTMLAVAPGNVDPISGPFAGGLALACIVQALAHVSGAMVNPAMSLGFFTCRRISFIKLCLFSLAQCAGAISGSALLKAVTPSTNHALHAMGSTTLAPGVTIFHGICIEIMITFLLVFLTVSATDGRRVDVTGSIPLIIGLAIVACSFAALKEPPAKVKWRGREARRIRS